MANINQINPDIYDAQLQQKAIALNESLSSFNPPQLEVFPSKPLNYRMRAEFRIWHDGDDLFHIMFDKESKKKYRVDNFPAASLLINKLMPQLIAQLKDRDILRKKLFQIDYLSTLSGEILVSMLYHKQLDTEWENKAKELKDFFIAQGFNINIVGRAKKQKILLDKDFVIEELKVNQDSIIYKQVENSFTQPNAEVAQQMLEWSRSCTENSSGDLLELYCGNGNFSLALSKNFNRVLATELAKPSVHAAQYNIQANHIKNVQIIRMSAEDFTDAMQEKRVFKRLVQQNINLKEYKCNTILVDPPRAGMDDNTCKMVQEYNNIVYISCNPETLKANLNNLCNTHKISRFALFDQFPYTEHMECGVLLTKK